MAETITLTIQRFDPSVDNEPYYKDYEVPNDDPDFAPFTALKALHYVNRYFEPIGYDYNCRRDSCGRCAMMIDGQPHLACGFVLSSTHTLEPLKGFPIIRDLVVDKKDAYAKFVGGSSSIKTLDPETVTKSFDDGSLWLDKIYSINACRECMSCYGICSALQINGKWDSFAGPGATMQVYMRSIDTMDHDDRVSQAVFAQNIFECIQCGLCNTVCPAGIPIQENIKELMDKAEARGLKPETDSDTTYWPLL
ncbi:MAG: 4Fe-4S dicluster domain-containing protein [Coriobacteriales bacterium]|jgi:succinate dehydrogenase/fumarate reductase iron-sulfur protein|nr:4Fe-4S dicluster domain-containing protein [Coriobacteriales bacterium]